MQKSLSQLSSGQSPLSRLQKLTALVRPAGLRKRFITQIQADRFITHLVILSLILAVASMGGLPRSRQELKMSPSAVLDLIPEVDEIDASGQPLTLPGVLQDKTYVLRYAPGLQTTITTSDRAVRPVKVEEIRRYQVQPGDTVSGIAQHFALAPETILWANPGLEDNPDLLRLGQELTILPLDGVYHRVNEGDTIANIAAAYKVEAETIINYRLNELDPENPIITPGRWLVVPGGIKPYTPKYVSATSADAPKGAVNGTGTFHWPVSGTITQDFWSKHRALDIATWDGAPIYAADSGYVVVAQWDNTGYGLMAIIDHGNGFKTLYAHTSRLSVSAGDEVLQGAQIGEVGSSGNSTGPHLHFEIITNGVKRNPWGYLP